MRNRPTGFNCWHAAQPAGVVALLLIAGCATRNPAASRSSVEVASSHSTTISNETVFALLLPAALDARRPVVKNETLVIAVIPVSSNAAGLSVPANQLINGHPTDE